jgi:tetratricopeptide (TPR) repeat protein
LPLLGIIQNGPQIAADRYTYLAAPALAILAAGAASLLKRPWAIAPAGVAAGILLGLGALTWNQSQIWRDSEVLWSRVLSVDPQSSIGHVALGSLRIKQNRLEEGIDHYERALAIDPDYAEGYNNLGVALARQQRFADATESFRRALAYRPTYDEAHNNWGVAEAQQGNYSQAIDHYRQALAINPRYADAHANWGNALARLSRADEAIAHYQEALVIRPDHADAQLNWGVVLAQQGKLSEAVEHFRQALAINPDLAEAREYLERAMQLQQRQSSLRATGPIPRLAYPTVRTPAPHRSATNSQILLGSHAPDPFGHHRRLSPARPRRRDSRRIR